MVQREISGERYSSPPVIEIYAQIKFAPAEDKTDWGLQSIEPLLDDIRSEFERLTQVKRQDIRIHKEGGKGLPRVESADESLDRIQLFSRDSTWCLQFGEDLLVCNLRRVGEDFPHYSSLVPHLKWALAKYVEFMGPSVVQWHALNYVDLFHIAESRFDLNDYFQLGLEVPGSFPDLTALNFDCALKLESNKKLTIKWQDVSTEGSARFRVDWSLIATEPIDVDAGILVQSTDDMHDLLVEYFEEIATDKLRASFGGDR